MSETACWILRCEHRLLTIAGGNAAGAIFPSGSAADFGNPENALRIGHWAGLPCYAADVAQWPEIPSGEPTSLRAIFQLAGPETFALAGRATQLLDWQSHHRFCGQCGTPTTMKSGELAMQCPSCGLLAYPRISPAVMVLVRDGDRLLLARSPHFKPGVFSALAGFVEPGETLEECAAREVREEVGIEIANLRYFHSQPWPFPNSLMVAFFADYAGGTITPDPKEIEAADWFALAALPLLPEPISISRRLIDAARYEGGEGSGSISHQTPERR
ncbi:MAG: NAD(+) diphosphatase [Dechloromonas sp.]|nr:NAD(+) diphosphatase [Dechloromonas sp.]